MSKENQFYKVYDEISAQKLCAGMMPFKEQDIQGGRAFTLLHL
jgi:hypothetical protein